MKILIYDIETSPLICYTWGLWQQNAAMLKEDWKLLTVAYKWLGDKRVSGLSRLDYRTERELVQEVWNLFEEADIIVAHNGNSFDQKKMTAKFIEHCFSPPAPYKQIDTKLVAKRYGKFTSNSLDNLCNMLKMGRKVKHEGIELWDACMQGDKKAYAKMMKYNKQDVKLLEKLYLKLRPWITNHPNVAPHLKRACPKCGSARLRSKGIIYTNRGTLAYRSLVCLGCGGPARERVPLKDRDKPEVV